jgi:hypothetical protein
MNPYITPNRIDLYAEDFTKLCGEIPLIKISYIRKRNGKWVVLSRKGKVLGTYDTKDEAVDRLRAIEYFKNKGKKASKNEEQSYSSTMRELRKSHNGKDVKKFQEEYKRLFDAAVIAGNEDDSAILDEALKCISNEENEFIKRIASAIDLGDPAFSGKYLADLIKFLLRRISAQNRQKAINSLKKKIYYINEFDIAAKKTPPSSSMGQSITLIKTILLEHSPQYIRSVLNNIVSNL